MKKDGEFKSSLKYLGLEFVPPGLPSRDGSVENDFRLKASTRNGSKMDFTTDLQLACFLAKKYDELIVKYEEHVSKLWDRLCSQDGELEPTGDVNPKTSFASEQNLVGKTVGD